MPGFRWELKNDIALVSEVATHRPLKPADWDEIASTLSDSFLTEEKPVLLKARGCKDRLDLLLKKYTDEDTKALQRCVCVCVCVCGFACVYICVCALVPFVVQVWY